LTTHLDLDANLPGVRAVLDRYQPEKAEGQRGTHFFKGRVGRFREAFSQEEQAALADSLGPYLALMGYTL